MLARMQCRRINTTAGACSSTLSATFGCALTHAQTTSRLWHTCIHTYVPASGGAHFVDIYAAHFRCSSPFFIFIYSRINSALNEILKRPIAIVAISLHFILHSLLLCVHSLHFNVFPYFLRYAQINRQH